MQYVDAKHRRKRKGGRGGVVGLLMCLCREFYFSAVRRLPLSEWLKTGAYKLHIVFSIAAYLQFVTFLFASFFVVVLKVFSLVCQHFRHKKMSVDTEEIHQRLKAVVHFTVGRLCQKIGEDHRRQFSRQAIAAIAETTFRQCDIFAKDLEAFARHAKRSTVSVDDVKLVARRSTALSIYIQNKNEELTQEHLGLKKKTTGKRKSIETEESRE